MYSLPLFEAAVPFASALFKFVENSPENGRPARLSGGGLALWINPFHPGMYVINNEIHPCYVRTRFLAYAVSVTNGVTVYSLSALSRHLGNNRW